MDRPARRPERPEDDALLFAIFRDSHGDAFADVDPGMGDTLLRRQFTGQMSSYRTAFPGAQFDVVEVDGAPIGRVVTDAADGALRLVDLALLSAWRGRGLGTRLVRVLQAEARVLGVPLRLSVMRSNARAHRLYERLGFAVEAEHDVSFALRWDA